MKFTARYMHRRHEEPEYYRTIAANSLNEAIKLSERMTRKGFIMTGTTSTNDKEQ